MHELRTFLRRLERTGELRRVETPLDPVLETTALAREVLRADGPALLMTAVGDSPHPMLANLFGSRRRVEAALGDRPLASLRELGHLLASLREPRLPGSLREALSHWPELGQLAYVTPKPVKEAAFNDIVLQGDAIDLTRLPIQTCWPEDAGPLVTLGLVTTRGTRKTRQNVAIYRQQVIGPRRLIMRWLPHRGGALDFADWCADRPGEPFPLLVSIGVDPATLLAAVAPIPDTVGEYEFAGLLRGERTRVWHSRLTGLDAAAGAEIVLEGFIHPGDTALEGPFGDHTGHYNAQGEFPVFTVETMRLRSGAIYHGSYMGRSPHDEPSVMAMALNEVFSALEQGAIEGQENPIDVVRFSSFFEVAPYVAETNHLFGNFHFQLWGDTFDAYPAEVQEIILEASDEVSAEYRATSIAEAEANKEFLVGEGVEFSSIDIDEWRAAVSDLIDEANPQVREWANAILDLR